MDAEQLIQDKEWNSLTADERAVVLALAADEQEFNLLKKMLLIAREEVAEVPPVSISVHEHLKEAIVGRQRKTFRLPRWTYAAAAVLALAVFGLLLLKETGRKKDEIKTPSYVEVKKKISTPDTSLHISQPDLVKVPPVKTKPYTRISKRKNVFSSSSSDQQATAIVSINTSVGMNSHLLDVVAEAY